MLAEAARYERRHLRLRHEGDTATHKRAAVPRSPARLEGDLIVVTACVRAWWSDGSVGWKEEMQWRKKRASNVRARQRKQNDKVNM